MSLVMTARLILVTSCLRAHQTCQLDSRLARADDTNRAALVYCVQWQDRASTQQRANYLPPTGLRHASIPQASPIADTALFGPGGMIRTETTL
jgi:hypothetical protein